MPRVVATWYTKRKRAAPDWQCPFCTQLPYTSYKRMRNHVETRHPGFYEQPAPMGADEGDQAGHQPDSESDEGNAADQGNAQQLWEPSEEALRCMNHKNMGLGTSIVAEVDAMLDWVRNQAAPLLRAIDPSTAVEYEPLCEWEKAMALHKECSMRMHHDAAGQWAQVVRHVANSADGSAH